MRPRVLLHTAVLLNIVSAFKILTDRARAEHLGGGILSFQNLPLGLAILSVALLTEVASRKLPRSRIFLLFVLGLIFLLASFYVYPQNDLKDQASVLACGVLLLEFSIVVVSVFSRRAGLGRVVSTAFLTFLILSVLGFVYTFSDAETYDHNSRVDAVVVLGASVWGRHKPSPLLRGRLDAAMRLFKGRLAKKVVVTGGTKRFGATESEVEASYLHGNGIRSSNIIMDKCSLSTPEQVDFVKNVLVDSLKMKRIVIVSDRWHLPRVLLMCRWQNARVQGMASSYRMSLPSQLYYRLRESAALQVYLFLGT